MFLLNLFKKQPTQGEPKCMTFSQKGLDLLKQFEGCKLDAYQDIAGIWTIGYGTAGPDIVEGLKWTQEQADERLMKDVEKFATNIDSLVRVALNQNQFDSLVCFTYNVGLGAFQRSTLLKKVNMGSFKAAADEFLRWTIAGGKVSKGLVNRRTAERELFLSGIRNSNTSEKSPRI